MYYIYLFSTKVCYQLRIGRRKIRFVSIFDRIAFHNSEHIFGVLPFSLKVFSNKIIHLQQISYIPIHMEREKTRDENLFQRYNLSKLELLIDFVYSVMYT